MLRITTPDGEAHPAVSGKLVMPGKTVGFGASSIEEDGQIRIEAVPGPSLLFVRPSDPKYAVQSSTVVLTRGENRLHVALRSAAVLSGQVVDDRGKPVDGAKVTVVLPLESSGVKDLTILTAAEAVEKPSLALISGVGEDTLVDDPGFEIRAGKVKTTINADRDGSFSIKGLPEGAVVTLLYTHGWKPKGEIEKTVVVSSQQVTLVLPVR